MIGTVITALLIAIAVLALASAGHSLVHGIARARAIMAELAAIDNGTSRAPAHRSYGRTMRSPRTALRRPARQLRAAA